MLYTLESTIRQENRREKCSNPFFALAHQFVRTHIGLHKQNRQHQHAGTQHTNTMMAHPSSRISSSCNSFKFKTKPNIVIRRPSSPPTHSRKVKSFCCPHLSVRARCLTRVESLPKAPTQSPTTMETALRGCYFPPTRVGSAIWCGGWESGLFRMWGGYLLLKLYVIITKRVSRYWFAMAEINLELFWKTWTWLLFLEELPVDARQLFLSNPLDRYTGSGEVRKILLSDTLKT